MFDDVLHVLVPEVADRRHRRVGGRTAEHAERSLRHRLANPLQAFQNLFLAIALGYLVEEGVHLVGADATGRAFSAGLVDAESHVELGDIDDAVVLVHDDHAARSHHGTEGDEALIGNRDIEIFLDDDAAGGTTGLDSLELLPVPYSSADIEDDLPQRGSHRNLDEARVVDLAGEGKNLGALGLVGADGGEPGGSSRQDDGDIREGFDVVDDGRLAPETLDGGEWRLRDGHAAVAFDGLEKGRLFAADEGACAQTDFNIKIEAGAEDVVAHEAHFLGLRDGDLEPLNGEGIFGADVDVAHVGADRLSGDDHRLKH